MSIDTQQQRDTPEGITLTFPVAGPPIRLLAWLHDALYLTTLQFMLAMVLGLMGAVGSGLYLISAFLLTWFYPVYFEVWHDGSTPGKRRQRLQVIHDDGTPVGLVASLLRNLLRTADFLPAFFAAGLLSMTIDRDFRRLGDLAAGTLVVYRHSDDQIGQVPRAVPVVPRMALSHEERRTLVDFASRLPRWTDARAQELANIARPLTGASGATGVQHLVGIANWTLGRAAPTPSSEPAPSGPAPPESQSLPEAT